MREYILKLTFDEVVRVQALLVMKIEEENEFIRTTKSDILKKHSIKLIKELEVLLNKIKEE